MSDRERSGNGSGAPARPTHDIVVVGASAGGVETLTALVGGLPPDLPAAVFVVLHLPPYSASRLSAILDRAAPLPAAHPEDGEAVVPGRIIVAPPDRHLLLRPGRVALARGPRENHARPAIDPLFRTAARAYGSRVVGVVLSGALYDGSAGLLAIQARGGVAVVQDPAEAAVGAMPRNALRLVAADHVLPASAIGPLLGRLAREPVEVRETRMTDQDERMAAVIEADFEAQAGDRRIDAETLYTCPDCGGVMWQSGAGPALRFRCHVGHAYGLEVLLGQKSEELEAALWSCVRLLKERATLTRQTALQGVGGAAVAARIGEQAQRDEEHARIVRELLESMPNLPTADAGTDEAFKEPRRTNGGRAVST